MTVEEIEEFAKRLNPPIELTEIQKTILKKLVEDPRPIPFEKYRQSGWTQTLMLADMLKLKAVIEKGS